MSEAASALECGLDARCDAPVAAGAGIHFLIHQARQAQWLLDQCMTPAMRIQVDGPRQRDADVLRERAEQKLRDFGRV